MGTMNKVLVAVALVGGCVAGDPVDGTQQAAQPLTGSGSGSGSGSGATTTTVWHSSMNGGGAGFTNWDWNTGTALWLNAWEYGTAQSRTAFLNFNLQGPDPSSQVCDTYTDPWWGTWTYCYYTAFISEWGWGQIPSSDFTVGANAASARLHTTTGSDFYIEKCTYSWWPWGWNNCTYSGSESFDVAWNKNGFSSNSQDGTTVMTFGAYAQQVAGRLINRSASATGTAAGYTLSSAFGTVQDTQGITISRDIVKAGP